MNRPPKFVHGFIDRHGKPRFYFRRAGFKKVPLPGLPWSPEFMEAYEEALAGQRAQVGANRVKDGTIRALAASYFASPAYRSSLRPNSQRVYRSAIDVFCRNVDRDGAAYGDKMVAGLRREHVVKIIASKADTPQSANFLLKVLRALVRQAVEIGLRSDDPTEGVRPLKFKSDGHHAWSEKEITQFEQTHPLGSRERLAFALLLHTGQRRSDVIRMGYQHMQDGLLRVRQEKTGAELVIPVNAELAEAIAASPGGNLTFLITRFGRPFTPVGFTNWFSTACDAAGLPSECTAHGLRKSCARRRAEAGCTEHEIAAITGHASLAEVQRYTRSADQKRLAIAAMAKVKARTETGKPNQKV
jgi:integrase